MAIDEDSLPVQPGKERLDTTKVTQTDGTEVHREAVHITDPEKRGHRANVLTRGPAPSLHDAAKFDHDLGVSDYRLQVLQELLQDILGELKIHTQHLQIGSDEEIFKGDIQ